MPTWGYYMAASCFTAFLVGWLLAYIIDTWNDK